MASSGTDLPHRFDVKVSALCPFHHSLTVEMKEDGLKSRIGLQELRGRRKR